ncbi:hypothetical protein ACR6A2_003439 [Escherichia coli]|uniref:hypothetical protein n=1 Tax=Escherichia coli TaxID=562 RepID=UPI002A86B236|nr:hypothetical protein [Escherichia coli]MEC9731180.1 hypothetical protein [Escherichia marmotae]MDY4436804.1 hypothetical protein [Escherichia coli]MED0148104.1 hypothetical protein [Escherichia coli]MED0300710.1 hypothetical protein [Escherichia coli]
MTWPEAFTTVGIAMAVALVVYSICRWGVISGIVRGIVRPADLIIYLGRQCPEA